MKKIYFLFISFLLLSGISYGQCLDGYSYITPVTVVNSNVNDTLWNYQVKLYVNTQNLIGQGKMQADADDIRFTDGTCCNIICHTTDSGVNTASTVIWVKVPMIPANDSVTLFMAYGNPSAVSGSNPSCVFDFWEGFDSSNTRFNNACGTITENVSGGVGTYSWSSSGIYISDSTFSKDTVYTTESNVTGATGTWPGIYWAKDGDRTNYGLLINTSSVRISLASTGSGTYCIGHNWASPVYTYTTNTGLWQLTWVATGNIQAYFQGYGNITSTNNVFAKDTDMRLAFGGISSGTGTLSMDWIRVRKWSDTIPTFSYGAEIPLAPITVSLGADTSTCGSDSVQLNAGSGFYSYNWSTGSTGSTTYASSGAVYVTVTDSIGCPASDTIDIVNYPAPVVNIGPDSSICPGDTLMLNAGNYVSFSWSDGSSGQMLGATADTSYWVMVTDSNGCTGSDTMDLSLFAAVTAGFSYNTTGATVNFTDTSTNAVSWSWDFGDGNDSTIQNPAHTYATSGSYYVCLEVQSADGCTDITCDTVTVTVVGTEDALASAHVKIYPVPVQQMLNIEAARITGICDLSVVNLHGSRVWSAQADFSRGVVSIDSKDWPAGIYFLQITKDGQQKVVKFIRQ